jgi:hypothetical protein
VNIGFVISNAKAQMSNECQSPKSKKNVMGKPLSLKKPAVPAVCRRSPYQASGFFIESFRHLNIWI